MRRESWSWSSATAWCATPCASRPEWPELGVAGVAEEAARFGTPVGLQANAHAGPVRALVWYPGQERGAVEPAARVPEPGAAGRDPVGRLVAARPRARSMGVAEDHVLGLDPE